MFWLAVSLVSAVAWSARLSAAGAARRVARLELRGEPAKESIADDAEALAVRGRNGRAARLWKLPAPDPLHSCPVPAPMLPAAHLAVLVMRPFPAPVSSFKHSLWCGSRKNGRG